MSQFGYDPFSMLGTDASNNPASGLAGFGMDPYSMLGGDASAGQMAADQYNPAHGLAGFDPYTMLGGDVSGGATALGGGANYGSMDPNAVDLGAWQPGTAPAPNSMNYGTAQPAGYRGGGASLAGAYGGQMRPSQEGLMGQYQQQQQAYNAAMPLYNSMYNLAGQNEAFLNSQNAQQQAQEVGNTTQRLMAMGLGNSTVLPSMQNQAAQLGQIRGENIAGQAAQQKQNALGQQAQAVARSYPVQSPYLNQNVTNTGSSMASQHPIGWFGNNAASYTNPVTAMTLNPQSIWQG